MSFTFYDIRLGNGVGLFLQPRSPYWAAAAAAAAIVQRQTRGARLGMYVPGGSLLEVRSALKAGHVQVVVLCSSGTVVRHGGWSRQRGRSQWRCHRRWAGWTAWCSEGSNDPYFTTWTATSCSGLVLQQARRYHIISSPVSHRSVCSVINAHKLTPPPLLPVAPPYLTRSTSLPHAITTVH